MEATWLPVFRVHSRRRNGVEKRTDVGMEGEIFPIDGRVEIFPQDGGWTYVRVAREHSEVTRELADRGLVAVKATVGQTTWDTSLLPMGDGTHFIALNKKVRDAEGICVGDRVSGSFVLRTR
jgi:hypothetical protein